MARHGLHTRLAAETAALAAAAALLAGLPWPFNAVGVACATLAAASFRSGRAQQWHLSASEAATRLANGDYSVRMEEAAGAAGTFAEAFNRAAEFSEARQEALNAALDEAARQRDRFESIFTASSDGLLLYDAHRVIVAANPRVADLLSFTLEQLTGTTTPLLAADLAARTADPKHYQALLDAHFADPERPREDVLVVERPRRRVLKRFSSPVRHGGTVVGRVFTYTDVTAEADIDQMKNEFVAMASHELRTPLTSVHAALQLTLSGSAQAMDAEDREMLQISLANTERLVRLVNDLLDLSKIEAGRMPFSVSAQSVPVLVDDAMQAVRALAMGRGIALHARDEGPLDVEGDRDQLVRVITNLLSNALKYSPPHSTITVDVRGDADKVRVAVQDEGPGIADDQVDRLFRPFSRVGAQERQTTGGTGLGLAISRAIVEQHGGRMWWERNQPTGSRFVFTLPTRAAQDPRQAATAGERAA